MRERYFVLLMFILSVSSLLCAARENHAPLSPLVLSAKKVYLENHASAKISDKLYQELKERGHWEIVRERSEAQLVIVLYFNGPDPDL